MEESTKGERREAKRKRKWRVSGKGLLTVVLPAIAKRAKELTQ